MPKTADELKAEKATALLFMATAFLIARAIGGSSIDKHEAENAVDAAEAAFAHVSTVAGAPPKFM